MSDNVMYTKPFMLTDEKVKAAVEKQAKQRALREALDKQIEQTKKNKVAERRSSGEVSKKGITQRYTFDYENGCGKFILCDKSNVYSGVTSMAPSGLGQNVAPSHPLSRPLHQSNSLPPNFSMSTSESNPLAPKRSEYNTNSLPVNLETALAGNRSHAGEHVNGSVSPSQLKEVFVRGTSARENDSPRGGEYQTNCLPMNFNLNDVKTQFQFQHPQKTPRSAFGVGHPTPRHPPHTAQTKSPKQFGGPLPPLELVDGVSAKRTPERARVVVSARDPRAAHDGGGGGGGEVRELKPKQPALRGPSKGRMRPGPAPATAGPVCSGAGAGAVPRNVVPPERSSGKKVELLQKKLESREFEMAKMREKERNWEEQVKRLKIELKNARKKERDLNKLVNERPRRAETAPDQPTVSTPVIPSAPSKKNGGGPSPFVHGGKKQDFAKSGIFQPFAFRAITAPSESMGSSYRSSGAPTQLPPLQDSFKLSSTLTCKTAFGLPKGKALVPVPIEYEHLLQFVEAQIITQQQADELWKLFANEESPLALLRRGSAPANTAPQSSTEPVVTPQDLCLSTKEAVKELEKVLEEDATESAIEETDEDKDDDDDDENDDDEEDGETYETFAELVLDEHQSQEDMAEYDLDHLDI